jgi:undecaprenyl-diphosphatase
MTDPDIVLAFQRATSTPFLRNVVGFCARWLIYLFIPFAIAAYRTRAFRAAITEAAWSALVAFTLSSVISIAIGRVRPYLAVKGVIAVVPPNIQYGSFPSSHTAIAVAIAIAFSTGHPVLGLIALVAVMLIAFARIAAGMHFPTDILGGVAVGIIAVLLVRAVRQGMGTV